MTVFDHQGNKKINFLAYSPDLKKPMQIGTGQLNKRAVIVTAIDQDQPLRIFNWTGSLIKEINFNYLNQPKIHLWSR